MFLVCSNEGMKQAIDVAFLRTLIGVRLTLADRAVFRDLWQHRDRLRKEARREELVAYLTRGWDSYGLKGEADPDANRHDVPSTSTDC